MALPPLRPAHATSAPTMGTLTNLRPFGSFSVEPYAPHHAHVHSNVRDNTAPWKMVQSVCIVYLESWQRLDGGDDLVLAEQVHGPQQLAEAAELERHRAPGHHAVLQVDPV